MTPSTPTNRTDDTLLFERPLVYGEIHENFSGKDKKGELVAFDKTGVCAKLN